MSTDVNLGRHSIRLRGYDYSLPGAYFVTICAYQRKCVLADIPGGLLRLTETGRIAQECWAEIPAHFPHVYLDVYVIMPNHIHGILGITDRPSKRPLPGVPAVAPGSLAAVVRAFKSATTRRTNLGHGTREPLWQRNYYEHIVRSEKSLQKIREYIVRNPVRWQFDPDNPAHHGQFSDEIEEILTGDSAPDNDG
jgi:REP element-mobilizing transposase RayT